MAPDQPRISPTECVQEMCMCVPWHAFVHVCVLTESVCCVYVLLAKLQNSDSTPVVIDSLEVVWAAGNSYPQLYCERKGWGKGERINKSSKD